MILMLFVFTYFLYAEDKTEFKAAVETAPAQVEEKPLVVAQVAQPAIVEPVVPGMITFSFKDADIRNVLRLIAAKSSVNIVYGPEVTGMVNMELKDVPWEQALSLVLDLNGFAYQKTGNVVKVLKKEDIQREPLSTEVFVLNYAKADELSKSVEKMLGERGSIKVDARSNAVIVTDIPANINRIEEVLRKVDTRTPQVLIETKIIEFSNVHEKDLGIKWTSLKDYSIGVGAPKDGIFGRQYTDTRNRGRTITDDYTYDNGDSVENETVDQLVSHPLEGTRSETVTSTGTGLFSNGLSRSLADTLTRSVLKQNVTTAVLSVSDFQLTLSALQENTDAQLVSSPKILTANNEKSKIEVVQEYPIPNYTYDTATAAFTISGFDYKKIGVTLDVTPTISSDGFIAMFIEPNISKYLRDIIFNPSGREGGEARVPLVAVKKASAKLILKSGDTLAIGGLVDEDNKNVTTKVPLLGDLPFLGRLFRNDSTQKQKTNIIFFITATIINEETKDVIMQKDMEFTKNAEIEYNKIFKNSPAPIMPEEKIEATKDDKKGNRGVLNNK
jgi:type IV pilus assembly protein PilQ